MEIMRDRRRSGLSLTMMAAVGLLMSLLVGSCGEDPTEANSIVSSIPLRQLVIRETTLVATGSSTFRQSIPMNGLELLLGRTNTYESSLLLEWYPVYFPARDTIKVLSATLTLRTNTFYGDSISPLEFTVYRISRSWDEATVTWDSVDATFYDGSVARGTYSGIVSSDTQTVSVSLDTGMVRQWFSTLTTDNAPLKYGIILIPSGSTRIIRGFRSFESDSTDYHPTLKVIAANLAGTTVDTSTYNMGIDTFVKRSDDLTLPPGTIAVMAGAVYRSSLSFDASCIPRGSIVNKADLQMHLDPLTSRISRFYPDSAVAPALRLSASDSTEFYTTETSASFGSPGSGLPGTFHFDVASIVQSWVRGPNYGLVLKVPYYPERGSINLFVFYDQTTATTALRPQLRIVYSTPKN